MYVGLSSLRGRETVASLPTTCEIAVNSVLSVSDWPVALAMPKSMTFVTDYCDRHKLARRAT